MSFARVLYGPPRCLASIKRRLISTATKPEIKSVSDTTTTTTTPSIPLSSCLEGTKIEGVNFLKGQAPVLAMADNQYPEWLWTILQPKVHEDEGPGSKAERQKRRAENKQRIKDRNFMSTQ
ncbi:hypothetical protein Ac2012v2_002128 [Leucoagaricus gongylophorus]